MIEELKKVNLVEFMNRCWNVEFIREGSSYVAKSPFRAETKPSFYVNQEKDGHYVWYDHGSGRGGTIIDIVMEYKGTRDIKAAIRMAYQLAESVGLFQPCPVESQNSKELDLEGLLKKLKDNDVGPVRQYLLGRGIAEDIVEQLIRNGLVVLNILHKSLYCCFAVRDRLGRLHGLFNRKIDGPSERERFLLGAQYPFCLDWKRHGQAKEIHICESIIDALSLQTLRPEASVLGFPGVHYALERVDCLPADVRLVECFDADIEGRNGAKRLRDFFPGYTILSWDLEGADDVNDQLCGKKKAVNSHSPVMSVQDRVELIIDKTPSRTIAEKYSIHHSRVCDIRNDAAAILSKAWSERQPGRKAAPAVSDEMLGFQKEHAELRRQFELLTMRNEWLELQVGIWEKRTAEAAKSGRNRKKKLRKKQK